MSAETVAESLESTPVIDRLGAWMQRVSEHVVGQQVADAAHLGFPTSELPPDADPMQIENALARAEQAAGRAMRYPRANSFAVATAIRDTQLAEGAKDGLKLEGYSIFAAPLIGKINQVLTQKDELRPSDFALEIIAKRERPGLLLRMAGRVLLRKQHDQLFRSVLGKDY